MVLVDRRRNLVMNISGRIIVFDQGRVIAHGFASQYSAKSASHRSLLR